MLEFSQSNRLRQAAPANFIEHTTESQNHLAEGT